MKVKVPRAVIEFIKEHGCVHNRMTSKGCVSHLTFPDTIIIACHNLDRDQQLDSEASVPGVIQKLISVE